MGSTFPYCPSSHFLHEVKGAIEKLSGVSAHGEKGNVEVIRVEELGDAFSHHGHISSGVPIGECFVRLSVTQI